MNDKNMVYYLNLIIEGILQNVGWIIFLTLILAIVSVFKIKKWLRVLRPTPKKNYLKKKINIAFIDDEKKLQIVNILKSSYDWNITELGPDIKPTDELLKPFNIIFVDIKGVSTVAYPRDQGLGLASSIFDLHQEKRIILMSGNPTGDHLNALYTKVHDRIYKSTDPSDFDKLIVEQSSILYNEGLI